MYQSQGKAPVASMIYLTTVLFHTQKNHYLDPFFFMTNQLFFYLINGSQTFTLLSYIKSTVQQQMLLTPKGQEQVTSSIYNYLNSGHPSPEWNLFNFDPSFKKSIDKK